MQNPTRTESIRLFLKHKTHQDLALMYNHDMEVQVNVAQDGGERDGDFKGRQWNSWTDGIQTWYSFRIPKNAATEPEYTDLPMSYDLDAHAEGIGMTGWDWKNKVSRWVAFDFDAMIGHSQRHQKKLTDIELKEIQDTVTNIPWVTLRKSTSGKGLHLYVKLDEVPTENHNEHAALARSILGILSAATNYDLSAKVDICGGNMWVWHRKMTGTDGLSLIKDGGIFTDIPPNWRDHVKVVSGRKKKATPEFIENNEKTDIFEELSGQRIRVKLDDDHKKLFDWLQENNCYWWWDQDHYMLVSHTYDLKSAHESLGFKGVFTTLATGKDKGQDINCFCFPLRKGGWSVRRYTPGVAESETWEQDGQGWTHCYYNHDPDLKTAARSNGGIEDEKGGFVFREAQPAVQSAQLLGVSIDIPNNMMGRKAILKEHKDGRLVVHVEHDPTDPGLNGWLPQKGWWKKIFNVKIMTPKEPEVGNYDDVVRHLSTESHEDAGWVIKSEGPWRFEPLSHIKPFLANLGFIEVEIKQIIGSSVARCWNLVNYPFKPEYPGDRKWNRDAAQLRFVPTQNKDNLSCPTWDAVLNHCGMSLDPVLKDHPWAKSNGILNGGDYLKCWIASVFQEPTEPLPYLFLYGPQNSGKSILHEALDLLVTKGVQKANSCLTSPQDFNAELENAILCVVEELDLRGNNRVAYNRIKDWVTSRKLNVHRKGETPYPIINTTHWVHCANEKAACPIFPGDSRITMLYVPSLDPTNMIPKKQIITLLEKEAPDFIAQILSLEIPFSNDRLNVPIIDTPDKLSAQEANKTYLEMFIDEVCCHIPGEKIKYSDFFERFKEWVDPNQVHFWTIQRIGRELPNKFPKGRQPKDGQFYIGNISFNKEAKPGNPYILVGDKLVQT